MAQFSKSSQILLPLGLVLAAAGVLMRLLRNAWPLVILTGIVLFIAGLFPFFFRKPKEKKNT